MRIRFLLLALPALFLVSSCNQKKAGKGADDFHKLMDTYWEERMQLFPLEATGYGDNRYNDRISIDIAQSFRDSLQRFYTKYLNALTETDTTSLKENDLVSWKLFRYEMQSGIDGLKYPSNLLPINQFWSFTITLPQLGSGSGNQPFKTEQDYRNFMSRMKQFPAWADTAIANMRLGIQKHWVLPKPLVEKVLPQLKAMLTDNVTTSIFYAPVKKITDSITNGESLKAEYSHVIQTSILPTYQRLYDFMQNEYLPAARNSSGVGDLPGGKEYYQYCVKYWTTTNLTPDSIYSLGLSEVNRIEAEMEKVKNEVGFTGDMQAFFTYLDGPQFFPFTTEQQVIDSFWNIKKAEDPQLKRLFNKVPKTEFTIRQTEAFRAASASAEYNPPSEDGSRPGIFYVPIINPKKFNAVGMETLFLHEAIPGHHYQIATQQENKDLPKFRRFLWYGAYGEGWALYSESLGKELGVYKNPYQYFGHLSDEMHRAIRLVVDVGLHWKGMTREEAIAFMVAHEKTSEGDATSEIERYMAIPGQALSYKVGQLTISSLRAKYEKELGSKFKVASFHDKILSIGCVPLDILEQELDHWAAGIRN